MSFPFREDPNTATILCKHIARGEKPILYVSHDEDDGMWQFLCNEEHTIEDLYRGNQRLASRKRSLERTSTNAVENIMLKLNIALIV